MSGSRTRGGRDDFLQEVTGSVQDRGAAAEGEQNEMIQFQL